MSSLDDHEIRMAVLPFRWKVKEVIGDAQALCAKAEAAEPLARQLLQRILTARDTLERMYDRENAVVRRRWLRAFEDALVAFSDALRHYCVKLFVDRVLLHQRFVADLKSIHGDLDRLFKQLRNDENRKSDWQEGFDAAVKAFGNAVECQVKDNKTREAYGKDSRLALEAAVLVRVAQKSADRLLWHDNPLAQRLWDANKEWKHVVVPDWFIRESTVSLQPKVFAKGGFGVVYRGTWGSATNVVVKRLLMGDYTVHAVARDQFTKKADLWFRMAHPNVLRLCGACHVAESPFFVSEDAQEGDLSEYLTRDKSRIWRQLFQTALAIEYLHNKAIIHRDLRLNNVFVFSRGQVRLAGFDLSSENAAGDSTDAVAGAQAGALRWRAPEALDGTCWVESDVYSFALCIIEAITGMIPYGDLDDDAATKRIRRAVLPDLPEDTRDEVRDLVTKMTKFAPADRMKIKDVISVLKKLANEEQNQDAASSLLCQNCYVSVPNGPSWCQKCMADIAETGSTPIRSAEDVPQLIQMAMLSDGHNSPLVDVVSSLGRHKSSSPMSSVDDHEIRMAVLPFRWKVKEVIGDAQALCAKAEAAEPLARQLLQRILTARDTLERMYDRENAVVRRRWLRAFEDALVAFSDALRHYCVKLFVDRVLLHQRFVADLKSIHGDLDRLFKQLRNDENRKSDWQEGFDAAVKAFGNAVECQVKDNKTREAYGKDSRLALEAAVLVRVAQKSADRLLWHDNPLAQRLWDANKAWKDVVVPDWFIPESTVSLQPRIVANDGFGVMYRGTWGSGTAVVVKRLMGDYADHAVVREKFMKGADLWFRMAHPNVLRLCGACHVAESPFFVSEEAQEGNLCEYLTRDTSRIWRQLFQTALAIEYLHNKAIIHRDLRLNNVFVFSRGQVRLAGFDLSSENAAGDSTDAVAGAQAGALRWRAPEALDGTCRVESDVYSFAMCIIEAITGEIPYGDLDDAAATDCIRRSMLPDLPTGTQNEVRDLVTKMTKFAPADRMKIKDVVSVLKKLANEEQNQDAASSLLCQNCYVYVPNGSALCPMCTTRAGAAKLLCDYLHRQPEDWFALVESDAILILRNIVYGAHDSGFSTDALKALGLLVTASSTAPRGANADIVRRKMQNIMALERVVDLFKMQLASDSDDMKCIAVKTFGSWPYREEIMADSDLMAQILELAENATSKQLRREASFALRALTSHTPSAA